MDDFISIISKAVLTGGPYTVVALLIFFVASLTIDKFRLNAKVDEHEKKLENLTQQCIETNQQVTEAISDLKVLIAQVIGKLSA